MLIDNTRKWCLKEVLEATPEDEQAKGLKKLDLNQSTLLVEGGLAVKWYVETDTFQFRIILQDKPLTRHGILSTVHVSSVYDPLGFLAPFTLVGKQILQQLCCGKADWDDPISDQVQVKWERWQSDLLDLEELTIPRCFVPHGFAGFSFLAGDQRFSPSVNRFVIGNKYH